MTRLLVKKVWDAAGENRDDKIVSVDFNLSCSLFVEHINSYFHVSSLLSPIWNYIDNVSVKAGNS